jgi:hypothetical protein
MAHRKRKGLPVKIHGGAAVMGDGTKGHVDPKYHRKNGGLKTRGRKVRKIGTGRM